ncbi:hypothetical protein M1D46_01230 [Microbacterium sp. JZ70]
MSALSTSGFLPDRPPLHLPYVGEEERDVVLEEITDLFDDLPTLCLTVAQKHIREDQLDVPTNERVFAALVALVETMLDEDGPEISPEQHGQLLFLTLVPGVTFAVALQVAFGVAMADANVPRFAELTACLERVGLDADGDVVLPQPPPTFAPLARVLRGEARRAIDIARVPRHPGAAPDRSIGAGSVRCADLLRARLVALGARAATARDGVPGRGPDGRSGQPNGDATVGALHGASASVALRVDGRAVEQRSWYAVHCGSRGCQHLRCWVSLAWSRVREVGAGRWRWCRSIQLGAAM